MNIDLPTAPPSPHIHPQARMSPRRVPEGEQPFILANTYSSLLGGPGESKPAASKGPSQREASPRAQRGCKPPAQAHPELPPCPAEAQRRARQHCWEAVQQQAPHRSTPGRLPSPALVPARPHPFAHHRSHTGQADKEPPVTLQELPIAMCGLSKGRGISDNNIKLMNWKPEYT